MPQAIRKFIVAAALLLILPLSAWAAQPYNAAAFKDAQAAGKSILIHVHASWCPTCKVQTPIVERLEKANPKLTVFIVDFDKAKDVVRGFGAQQQSTLIMFRGATEVGRSAGATDPAAITQLVGKGL